MELDCAEKLLLSHHEQQPLCTTRLPYRQGRKLTAVKVYTVNNESKHLLLFGVPSLNLRQETKALLSKFGKVQQLNISNTHKAEVFTETFHAEFEKIQSARIAKKMLDTRGFYGGVLHVCYAPEYETVDDTRQKFELRRRDVFLRLKNLNREKSQRKPEVATVPVDPDPVVNKTTLNMGEVNVITFEEVSMPLQRHRRNGKEHWSDVVNARSNKRKSQNRQSAVIEKQFKPCFMSIAAAEDSERSEVNIAENDAVDLTDAGVDLVTNIDIDKTLNFSSFGKELIIKVPPKPVNVIKFHCK